MRIEKTFPEQVEKASPEGGNRAVIQCIMRDVAHEMVRTGSYRQLTLGKNFDERLIIPAMSLITDFSMMVLTLLHAHWLSHGRKTYQVCKGFFDIFKRLDLSKLTTDSLPSSMSGYVELPEDIKDKDGDAFRGFYFFVGPGKDLLKDDENWTSAFNDADGTVNNDSRVIALSWLDDTHAIGRIFLPFNGGEVITDVFSSYKYEERALLHQGMYRKDSMVDGLADDVRIMLNLLVYLESAKPDLRTFRNEIKYQSRTSRTPVRKDKSLSQEEIILVGFGYEKSNIYKKDIFMQPPYWATRHFGEGRSKSRRVLVMGSVKHRSAHLLNQSIEPFDGEFVHESV